ncbi:MAG: hypothetical protein RIQ56_419 [Candidatus Parcubacteria bacterium]|jgi:hypothetical protein
MRNVDTVPKDELARLFAAFWAARSQGENVEPVECFDAEQFLGVLHNRAIELAKDAKAKSNALIAWLRSPDALDDFWESIERLGTQERTLGVVTLSSEIIRLHRSTIEQLKQTLPGLVQLVQNTFHREKAFG